MRHDPIPVSVFLEHRQQLQRLLPAHSLAVLNANDVLPTNADGVLRLMPNSDLFYLSGIEQEESVLVMAPDALDEAMRTMLFIRKPNPALTVVEGEKLSPEKAQKISGIKQVLWLEDLDMYIHKLMCEMEHVYLNSNEHLRAVVEVETRDARFIRDMKQRFPLHDYRRLARLMHELRVIKSPAEIALMQKACDITKAGFIRVLRELKPGMNECEVEAIYAYEFTRNRAFFAYNPIVASGISACTLHYNNNDNTCQDGDLLLLDVAASYANYNADLTRTIPVNGKFTPRQRQVYEAVLRIQKAMIKNAVPGKLWRDWQREGEDITTQELVGLGLLQPHETKRDADGKSPCKKYFMHGLGHPIGLDVHDVGHLTKPFAVGWTLTVEPGIYIPEERLAVRHENIIQITADGQLDLMASTPLEPDDIERLMAQR